ncbi:hypothetical protein C2E21_6038 [Chlorella sorokiniana]|uniref:Uncharacterized protein n=1 Tax=Chlorella sorokiniana TaxID=3076 RepID=A0A2P6TMM7_CHLSO|nr:hypothetical protein C2E21_6038 [Chlorella sorokiniana]|eukprot:PRW45565.1 hypothetical protein C2E21_6038 [Chlorella sorokiniana]
MDELQKRAAPPPLSADEERRQRLKAAGEAYFAKVLNSSKTRDLLGAAKSAAGSGAAGLAPTAPLLPGGGSAAAPAAPRLPLTTFDEDFLQAGAVIEGARTYVLGILFVAAQAAQLVFLKSSLDALRTPGLLLFLHLAPAALTLWLLGAQGVLELRPLSLRAVQGGVPTAALAGLQWLTLFWAVLRTPVFAVLCWTVMAPHALRAALDAAATRRPPPHGRLAALGAGLACTAATLLVQFPGVLGLLALLAWAATDLLAAAWAALRTRPEVLQQLGGSRPALAASLQQALDAEASMDHATLALLRHALPAVPALLLGLLLGEGSQLVDAELSVPAVTALLLSSAALALSATADQLMAGGLTRTAHEALVAAGPLGTVVIETAVRGLSSPIAFVSAVACAIAGVLLHVTAAAATS